MRSLVGKLRDTSKGGGSLLDNTVLLFLHQGGHGLDTIAAAQTVTLLASSGSALVVLIVLMVLARVVIISPLGKLVVAAKELETVRRGVARIDRILCRGEVEGARPG